jgi:3-dehydroquinate synthetase
MALTTLARSHRSEGLVEAYKTGLVADRELADLVETETGPLVRGDLLLLGDVACRAARAKAQVVEGDFRESHTRMILNFGHTFGHAVESFHRFRVSHGKCVSIGMALATEISLGRDLIHGSQAERMNRTLRRIAPYRVELPPEEVAWDFMRHDKKNRNQQTVFVLTEGPGKPLIVSDVSREEFSLALRKLRGRLNG